MAILAIPDGAIMKGKPYEGILRNLELARDNKGIADGKIQRPEFNFGDGEGGGGVIR